MQTPTQTPGNTSPPTIHPPTMPTMHQDQPNKNNFVLLVCGLILCAVGLFYIGWLTSPENAPTKQEGGAKK